MKSFLILLLTFSLVIGCTDRDDNLSAVNIRVKNDSSITFDIVQVGTEENMHSNIAPGAFSDYLAYETAFSYSYIEITSGEETFILQPIDFVGETELPAGFYTYELDIDTDGNVNLNFVVD